jgi:hypothetical protein
MLRRVALVRTDVSEEFNASFIKVTRICVLGTIFAVTSNQRTWYFFAAYVSCWLPLTFLIHRFLLPWWRRRYVPPKRRFIQEPRAVTSQKTPFFIVTAVKTSNIRLITNNLTMSRIHIYIRVTELFCSLSGRGRSRSTMASCVTLLSALYHVAILRYICKLGWARTAVSRGKNDVMSTENSTRSLYRDEECRLLGCETVWLL